LLLVLAYGLGAVPFAVLVARARGVDIRAVGSRNPGAHNVMTQVGRGWGWLVLVLDFAKGALPVLAAQLLGYAGEAQLAAGTAAMLGHITSPLLGGRGGKGQAAGLGMLLALNPVAAVIGLTPALVILQFTRMVAPAIAAAAGVILIVSVAQSRPPAVSVAPLIVIGLGLIATLPDARQQIRIHGGVRAAFRAWRGGREP
jgi:glycerol-3-phosphate acyltransferase PlsY